LFLGSVWLVAALTLGAMTSYREIQGQFGRQGYLHAAEKAVRGYLATRDRHYLEGEPHPIPYPDIATLAMFLDDRTIQSFLPSSVRLPIHVEKSVNSDESFVLPGCPPTVVAPLFERSWGSYSTQGAAGRGVMESGKISPRLPYLEFEIAGGLGPDMSLAVESPGRANKVRWLKHYPSDPLRPQWRLAYTDLPESEVRIVARDNSTEGWFAFREPRELGRLSLYAERLTERGKFIFVSAIALWGILLAARLLTYVRSIRIGRYSPAIGPRA
jgi:hypothetical protein